MRSMTSRSGPSTWIARGLRTPVASISVRVWMGIHQRLDIPGNCILASMALTRSSQLLPDARAAASPSAT